MSIFSNPVFAKSLEPPLVEAQSVFCLSIEEVDTFKNLYKRYGVQVIGAINQMQDLKCIFVGARFSVISEEEPLILKDHKVRVFKVALESGQEVFYLCPEDDKKSLCKGVGTNT